MKKWSHTEGEAFKNSDACFGIHYKPVSGVVDAAKISIRGDYPESGWSYNEEAHEIAVVIKGKGYIELKQEGRKDLAEGDVVAIGSLERFRWGGDMDLILSCSPAFNSSKYHVEVA